MTTTLTQEQIKAMVPHQVKIHNEVSKELPNLKRGATQKVAQLWDSILVRVSMDKLTRWREDVQLTLYLLQKEGVNVDSMAKRVGITPDFI